MQVQFVGCGGASALPALIPTHMSDDMLSRLDGLHHTAAHDGMIVEI